MASFINLLASDLWSEADILARVRAQVEGIVPTARQDELRTIMLGHIAQMRVATPNELGEIMQVGELTEQAAVDAAAARADMALLHGALAYEAALARLSQPEITQPLTVMHTNAQGVTTKVPNPELEQDALARATAHTVVDTASPEVLALHALRHPVVVASEPEENAPEVVL